MFLLTFEQKYIRVRDWVGQGGYTLLFRSPVLLQLADDIRGSGTPARIASFQMYPNYPDAYGIETAGGYQALTAKRYWEFWTRVLAPGADKFPSAAGDLDLGRVMLSPREHRPQWDLAELYNANLLSLVNARYLVSRDRLVAPSLKHLRGAEKPWSALDVGQKVHSNIAGDLTGRTYLYVYENSDALPRFFLADRLRVLESGGAVLDTLASADLDDLRRTAFVERAVLPPILSEYVHLSSGAVHLNLYEADRIRLSLDMSVASVLIVINSYSPFWRTLMDDVETPCFRPITRSGGYIFRKAPKPPSCCTILLIGYFDGEERSLERVPFGMAPRYGTVARIPSIWVMTSHGFPSTRPLAPPMASMAKTSVSTAPTIPPTPR